MKKPASKPKTVKSAPDFTREQALLAAGFKWIAGVDEVGRGPLAGPVVAAAVILDPDHLPSGLNDSKTLSAARRDALRAIAAMIPEQQRELYNLMLAVREPGTLARVHSYADRHGIGQSTVYFRIKKLAEAIQLHPWFDEITAPFRPNRRAA